MIVYKTHDWLQAIWKFHTGSTVLSLLKRLAFVFVYVVVVIVVELNFLDFKLKNTPTEFLSTMGILLSLLIIFRTNTAYDRFYEGRRTWGVLVNTCRNLAVYYNAVLGEGRPAEKLFFTKVISNFPFALKNHLRDARNLNDLDETVPGTLAMLQRFDHVPNGVVSQLRNRTELLYKEGVISEGQLINLHDLLTVLLDVAGICERIKSTPIPFSYSFFIKLFITCYIGIMPFMVVEDYGYLTIPAVMLVSYVLVGLEMIGVEIEEPFGLERNNLPLTQLSQVIRVNVHEIFGYNLPNIEKDAAKLGFVIVT
ncbi:hypothetical protein F5984_02085 [Rudanella paleaurantiibacter]|uniref:Bestrophin n=1 Tax=Rudanella paleaurantiibacter TaxID=2614655 RepID=A0A7J5U4Y7_9BACT|nr:bestrophin family ion channel [Rudanella paleaurantiibacter]KAB7732763.1 hypothetical protein F5984_02085 [Rudanella paleaurantiibacter]